MSDFTPDDLRDDFDRWFRRNYGRIWNHHYEAIHFGDGEASFEMERDRSICEAVARAAYAVGRKSSHA